MKKTITLLLLFICIAFSCEKDDLCPEDTPTTPRLVVEFRDFIEFNNAKNVAKLRVEDFDDEERVLEGYNAVTASQMLLPLKTNATETKYRVYKNYGNESTSTNPENADVITITYITEDVYVSRACSYKTIFNNIIITIDPELNDENWMQFAIPENENQSVINENEIHYTIRH